MDLASSAGGRKEETKKRFSLFFQAVFSPSDVISSVLSGEKDPEVKADLEVKLKVKREEEKVTLGEKRRRIAAIINEAAAKKII